MNKTFKRYYICSVVGVLLASFYPLYMGVRVVCDMIKNGTVMQSDYPKYVIPYTPISLAVIVGVLLMPLAIKYLKRMAQLCVSLLSAGVFFLSELLLESQVTVTGTVLTTLEGWQMYMCYVPPEAYETRTWRAVDVLIGDYSPTFKIHFYLISMVIILSLLNCFYGFAKMISDGDRSRAKALILQAISSFVFLGLCIFACFTAFFRDGELTVSPISAFLMSLFFVILGVTMGIYTGSFLLGKKKWLSVIIPSAVSCAVTVAMYVGETFLLSGHLYRFGDGFLFEGIGRLVLAPFDILIVLLSGAVCGTVLWAISKKQKTNEL